MAILEGDIKLLASRVMDDVPEGGGGPTGNVIPYGGNNHIFRDITEADRAGGAASVMQVHAAVMTDNAEPYMGANFILSMPPTDPNVSVTLAKCNLFARRTEIAAAIANYLIQSSEWAGYLFENHVIGQKNIQVFHRPGTPTPNINRTLVLTYNEGQPSQQIQYVRVIKVTTETRTFTYSTGGGFVDYQASVTQLDLANELRYNFPGSPPDRNFARAANKTMLRDTTVADAAVYYGASATTAVANIGDTAVRVASIYSQLVPNSRTETSALDQRPAATRSIVLAETPRRVEVPVAAHTQRIKIGQENRGFNYVFLLKPLPSPGTITISWMALGTWYTLQDDGAGVFTGSGTGQIIYTTGSGSVTLPSLPDVGSAVIIQWAETLAFTNRTSQGASVRPPEYAWVIESAVDDAIVPGSLVLTYPSAGTIRTVTDNGSGKLTGAGTGVVDYPSRSVLLRPSVMPDAGAQISVACELDAVVTDLINLTAVTPDAGGFVTFGLTQQPAAGTLQVQWATARATSNTSGGVLTGVKTITPDSGGGGGVVIDKPGGPGGPVQPTDTQPLRFRMDMGIIVGGTPQATSGYVILESVGTFAGVVAATDAMNTAAAAGYVPAGTRVGDTLTIAGMPMLVVQTREPAGQPTELDANWVRMTTLIYPSSGSPLGGAAWGLPA